MERKWRKLDSSCRVHPLFLNFLITDATLLSSLFPSLFHVPLLCSPYPFFHDHTQTELQKWWNCIYLKFENIKWNSLNIKKKNIWSLNNLDFFFLEKIEYNDARALCDHLNQKSRGPKFCHKCLRRDKKKSQI